MYSNIHLLVIVSVSCSMVMTIAMAINHPKADWRLGLAKNLQIPEQKMSEKTYCLGNRRDMN